MCKCGGPFLHGHIVVGLFCCSSPHRWAITTIAQLFSGGRGFCMRFFCCLSTFSRLRKQIARAKVVESLKNPYRHHLHPFWIDLSVLSTSAWMHEGATIDHENDARCKEMMCADIQIFAYRCVVCGGPTRKLQKGFVVCYTHTQSPFLLPSFLDDFLPWLGRNELSTTPKLHKIASVKLFI